LITPDFLEGKKGRPPFSLATMLRTHFLPQWFTLTAQLGTLFALSTLWMVRVKLQGAQGCVQLAPREMVLLRDSQGLGGAKNTA
jgi:hypothetical protein